MTTRQLIWLLNGCTITAMVIFVTIVFFGFAIPLEAPTSNTSSHEYLSKPTVTDMRPPAPSLEELATLWDIQLQRPLYDLPPPAPQIVPEKNRPPITIKLIGTIMENGRSRAMIIGKDGTTRFVSVGDVIDDVTIRDVQANQVVLERDQEQLTLTIKDLTQ